MKEFMLEETKMFQVVESKIRLIFDVLRNEPFATSSRDYHVVLFLLSAYKDNLFPEKLGAASGEWLNQFKRILSVPRDDNSKSYVQFGARFVKILDKISPSGLASIVKLIEGISKTELAENFPAMFDTALYRLSKSEGRFGGEYIQPLELSKLMIALADLPHDARIFNPFAGIASFGVLLEPNQSYFGQELNPDTWLLGNMRLSAHNRQKGGYLCANSFGHWPDEVRKFDLVIASPPMGLRFDKSTDVSEFGIHTIEQFVIEKGLNSISPSGKIIALFSQGWLFKEGKGDKELRKRLIKDDLIDLIISLPGGVLSNTGIGTVVLILNRQKAQRRKVRFVKGDSFIKTNATREKVLDYRDLVQLVSERGEDTSSMVTVDAEEIIAADYNLNVPRYFQKDVPVASAEQLVKLKDILSMVKGQKSDLPDTGKFLRIRDLKDDKLDFKLDVEKIEEVVLFDSKVQKLAETTLLLAMRWRSLKPTLFEFGGQAIYKGSDILAFKVNEAEVDYGYLINELHADYVKEQLDAYRFGTVVPSIRKEDLFEVAIKLPSLQEQKAKVKGIYELSNEIRSLQDKLDAQMIGESESQYRRDSSLKHRLGTPLLNIGSSLRNIERALSRKFKGWEEVKVSEKKQVTLKESFDSIQQMLQTIHGILSAGDREIDFSSHELVPINFLAFVRSYVNQVKASEKNNVTAELDIHPELEDQFDGVVMVNANAELLEIALNAIVENADKHGFVDDARQYKLAFMLSLYVANGENAKASHSQVDFDTFVKVEVANNGKTFPENFSLDKFVMKNRFAGETGNTGLGGYDLNEIIKFHNGGTSTLALNTNEVASEFTTTYSFLLPITN